MASSCASGAFFPLKTASKAKRLRYPRVGGREGIPLRPERHNPFSITSMRRRLTIALARRLPRCPCCQQPSRAAAINAISAAYDTVRLSSLLQNRALSCGTGPLGYGWRV